MIPIIGSSTVEAIGYMPIIKTMQVEFKSGSKYAYYDVSQEEYQSVLQSKSAGTKLKQVTRTKEYKKI